MRTKLNAATCAGAASFMLASCGGPDIEFKQFAMTEHGNEVQEADDFCVLRKETPDGLMTVLATKDGKERSIAFSAPEVHVPKGTETAEFQLVFALPFGPPSDFSPANVTFQQDGLTRIISFDATDEIMTFLAMTNDVAFTFNGELVGRYPQKGGYGPDLDVLAKCVGMTSEELSGIKKLTTDVEEAGQ